MMHGIFGGERSPEQQAGQGAQNTAVLNQPQAQLPVGQPAQQTPATAQPMFTADQQQQVQIPGQPAQPGQSVQMPGAMQMQPGVQTQDGQGLILGKFRDRGAVVQSMMHIGQKLGKQVDIAKVQSLTDDQLLAEYQEAERELGATSDVDRTRQENQLLKAELEAMKQYMQYVQPGQPQMPGFESLPAVAAPVVPPAQLPFATPQPQMPTYQVPYQQSRDPQTGRFIAPQQIPQQPIYQQPVQTPAQAQVPAVDPQAFVEQLYEQGPAALQPIIQQAVSQYVQTVLAQQAQQQEMQRQQAEFQRQQQEIDQQSKQQQTQRMQGFYATQIQSLKEKYGTEFEQYRNAAAQILSEKPHLAFSPSGMEAAFLEAKQRMGGTQTTAQPSQQQMQQQFLQQQYQLQQAAQKMAAQIPGSSGMYQQVQSPRYFEHSARKGVLG